MLVQLDFQVNTLVGQNSTYWYVMHPLYPQYGGFNEQATAYDLQSGWSAAQTVTIASGCFSNFNAYCSRVSLYHSCGTHGSIVSSNFGFQKKNLLTSCFFVCLFVLGDRV